MQLEPNRKWRKDIFLSQSEIYFENKWSLVELHNNGVPFVEFSEGSAWSEAIAESSESSASSIDSLNGETSHSDVYFRAASKKRVYSMDPYKILDLLGDMGGLLDIIMAFGVLITMQIVKKAFAISLLSDAYQVQGYTEDNSEYYESQKARQCFKRLSNLYKSQKNTADCLIELTSSNEDSQSKSEQSNE